MAAGVSCICWEFSGFWLCVIFVVFSLPPFRGSWVTHFLWGWHNTEISEFLEVCLGVWLYSGLRLMLRGFD